MSRGTNRGELSRSIIETVDVVGERSMSTGDSRQLRSGVWRSRRPSKTCMPAKASLDGGSMHPRSDDRVTSQGFPGGVGASGDVSSNSHNASSALMFESSEM